MLRASARRAVRRSRFSYLVDKICKIIYHRFIKYIFNNRLLQVLFSTLHPWIAYRIGNVWSRNSRLSHNEQYEFNGAAEPLCQFAEEYASNDKVDYFIFGHYHASADVALESGSRMLLLKDWISSSPYLCFDGEKIDTSANK